MGADATFRIASLTKPYTASVVMQLVAEGTLSLDDTVEHWLPGIVSRRRPITVRELLDHTSGVADYFDDPAVIEPYLGGDYEYVWTPEQLVEVAEQLGASSDARRRVELLEHQLRDRRPDRRGGHRQQPRRGDADPDLRRARARATPRSPSTPRCPRRWPTDTCWARATRSTRPACSPSPTAPATSSPTPPTPRRSTGRCSAGRCVEPELLAEMMPSIDDAVPYGLGIMAWSEPCGVAYGHDGGFAGYSSSGARARRRTPGRASSRTRSPSTTISPPIRPLVPQYDAIIDAALCG